MDKPESRNKYTKEQKQQLLDNLEIELAHRTRRLQDELALALENFLLHQEDHISRLPRLVRAMPVREFRDKYKGDVKAASKGLQMERMGGSGDADGAFPDTDRSTRKRKWIASKEAESGAVASDGHPPERAPSRASKNARITPASPSKISGSSTGPGTVQRAQLYAAASRPTGTSRTMGRIPSAPSPSPHKQSKYPTFPNRPHSPTKPVGITPLPNRYHPPSTNTFAPVLPKSTAFPTMRLPRRDENMLSVNGSPLANPYELGLGWFAGVTSGETDEAENESDFAKSNGSATSRRPGSRINVRRDPSAAFSLKTHSRTASQSSTGAGPPSTMAHKTNTNHRSIFPRSGPALPSQRPVSAEPTTPKTRPSHTQSITTLVSLPTSDGHLLEFDPLQTSPGQLDRLDGITDSAKKGAREEMGRLVRLAVERWKIT